MFSAWRASEIIQEGQKGSMKVFSYSPYDFIYRRPETFLPRVGRPFLTKHECRLHIPFPENRDLFTFYLKNMVFHSRFR